MKKKETKISTFFPFGISPGRYTFSCE